MNDLKKTKKQLVDELNALRRRIASLEREASDRGSSPAEEDERPCERLGRLSDDSVIADRSSVVPGAASSNEEGRTHSPAEILCISPSPAMESLAQVCQDLGHHCTCITDADGLQNLHGQFHLAIVAVKPGGHALFNGVTLHDLMVRSSNGPMVERGLLLGNMEELRGHLHAYELRASGYCQIGDPVRPFPPDLLARIRHAIVDVLRLPAYEPVNFFDEVTDSILHSVVESSQAPLLVLDAEWRIWFANLSAHAVFRRASQFLKGLPFDELLADPQDGTVFRERVAQGLGRGGGEIECRLQTREGREFDALIWYNPIYHEGITELVGCTFTDITRRKRAETELIKTHQLLQERVRLQGDELVRTSEQLEQRTQEQDVTRQALDRERNLLHTLINSVPDMVYAKDPESRFLLVNQSVVERLEVASAEEVIGRTDADFLTPEDAATYREEELEVLREGVPVVNREYRTCKPGRAPRWTLVTKVPLRDEHTGQIVGLVGLNRDITHLKQMEREMLAVERQHRVVLDAMADAIHVIDRDYRVVLVNRSFRDWLRDYRIGGEPIGRALREVVPFLPEHSFAQYEAVFTSGKRIEYEFEARVNGMSVIVEVRKVPIIEANRVIRVATILRDVTDRRQVEESLRQSEARVRQMVESLPMVLFSFEAGTNQALLVQGDVKRILGYERDHIFTDPTVGRRVVHPDDREAGDEAFRVGLASKRPFRVEFRILHGETGAVRHVQQYVVPVCDSNNQLVRHDSLVIDVTTEHEAEQRLKLLSHVVEQTSEGVAVADLDGRLLFLNRAWAAMHGGDEEDFIGRHLSVFHSTEQMPVVHEAFQRTIMTGGFEGEIWHAKKDGLTFLSLMHITLLRNESGAAVGCIGLMRDITAWKAMQSTSARLAEAVKNAGEGIAIWDESWRLTYANASMLAILGCKRLKDLVVLKPFNRIVEEGKRRVGDVGTAVHRTGVWRTRLRTERKDGSIVSLAATFSRLVQDGGQELIVGNFTDMSREEAQVEQIRRLGQEAAALLDGERARLSRELHDELGQQLTAMNLGLAWLESRLASAKPVVKERLAEVRDLQTRMTETVRGLARSLRTAVFDYQSLPDALQSLIGDYGQSSRITCRVKAHPPDLDVQNPLKTVIYRIAQEAMTNVVRHSGASRCDVELRRTAKGIELRVTDNGSGADPSRLEGTESLGIVGMKERAAALGGELRVDNPRGRGVRVTARFPWPPDKQS